MGVFGHIRIDFAFWSAKGRLLALLQIALVTLATMGPSGSKYVRLGRFGITVLEWFLLSFLLYQACLLLGKAGTLSGMIAGVLLTSTFILVVVLIADGSEVGLARLAWATVPTALAGIFGFLHGRSLSSSME
jgi:hypothetical protein